MKMDFVVAVTNSWRETPTMQALVGLLAVIALIYHLHFCKSGTRNEKVVPVWMMGNIILVKPIGYGLLLKNVIWARASEILCPWDNRSPPNGCIQ